MKSARPIDKKDMHAEKDIAKFIDGAGEIKSKPIKDEVKKNIMTWEEPHVRADVTKAFNLRLPEPLFLKLKFIAENKPRSSMHNVCIDILEPEIEREVSKLTRKLEIDS